jgi:hypothetical protein
MVAMTFSKTPTAGTTTCAKCLAPLADGHVCRRRPSTGTGRIDLFIAGVLGGSIGIRSSA